MLSDSDKAAVFSAPSPVHRLLPATLSDILWVFFPLLGAGDVALCRVIHKALHLSGAKSTNCAQNRAECVLSCILGCFMQVRVRERERNSGLQK